MYHPVHELKIFYASRVGRIVRRTLQERILQFWPQAHGFKFMGCGYAVPYLKPYQESADRVIVTMPPRQGAIHWPYDKQNAVCVADGFALPVETNSIDRILIMHNLEYARSPEESLSEIWRVLKSNGRALFIVPNRAGLWSHAEWTPFGHGSPYSMLQLRKVLKNARLVHERCEEALFMPPVKFTPILKTAGIWESIGVRYLPFAAGVHMVEVSKQIYARIDPASGNKVTVGMPKMLKPASKALSMDHRGQHHP